MEASAANQRLWATNAHRVGLSVFDIQDQGGWKKIDMVRRYTKRRPISELRRMPTPLNGLLRRLTRPAA